MRRRRLESEMARAGIDRRELADKTGISYETLCRYIRCEGEPNLARAREIKDVLGAKCTVETLFLQEAD